MVLGLLRVEIRVWLVVVALVRHLGLREHVVRVDEKQQVIVNLQVQAPRVGRVLDVVHRARPGRIAHVDDAEAARTDMADIGVAAMDDDLLPVRAPGLVAMPDEPHVARVRW